MLTAGSHLAVRILDTRDGTGVADHHTGPLGAGQVIELDVAG